MADEIKLDEDGGLGDLADLGFGEDLGQLPQEEEEEILSQDLKGFASGFPSWDLLPPKN